MPPPAKLARTSVAGAGGDSGWKYPSQSTPKPANFRPGDWMCPKCNGTDTIRASSSSSNSTYILYPLQLCKTLRSLFELVERLDIVNIITTALYELILINTSSKATTTQARSTATSAGLTRPNQLRHRVTGPPRRRLPPQAAPVTVSMVVAIAAGRDNNPPPLRTTDRRITVLPMAAEEEEEPILPLMLRMA